MFSFALAIQETESWDVLAQLSSSAASTEPRLCCLVYRKEKLQHLLPGAGRTQRDWRHAFLLSRIEKNTKDSRNFAGAIESTRPLTPMIYPYCGACCRLPDNVDQLASCISESVMLECGEISHLLPGLSLLLHIISVQFSTSSGWVAPRVALDKKRPSFA